MKTILLSDTETDLERAAAWIQAGEVVGMPTETVYGLAADACFSGWNGGISRTVFPGFPIS